MREVRLILKHAETDWRAAAWMLERRNPDRYGRNPIQPVELTTPAPRRHKAGLTLNDVLALRDAVNGNGAA
jgi:hypothetical protein